MTRISSLIVCCTFWCTLCGAQSSPHQALDTAERDHLAHGISFSSLLYATQACLNTPMLKTARLAETNNASSTIISPPPANTSRPVAELTGEQNVVVAYEKWAGAIHYSAAQPLLLGDLHAYRLFLRQMHPDVFSSPGGGLEYLTKEAALILFDTLMPEGSSPKRQAQNDPQNAYVNALATFYAKPIATRKTAYQGALSEIGLSME